MSVDKPIYFSETLANDLMSYNMRYNMIVSNRSYGKTYWILGRVIDNYLKKREQFIYLRRNVLEIDHSRVDNLFNKIGRDERFINRIALRVKGKECQLTFDLDLIGEEDEKVKWETFGYIMSLTQAGSFKSIDFPDVTIIAFEEFLIEEYGGRRYLPKEVEKVKDLYTTVARERTNVKVYLMANSISMNNPYFNYFGLYPYSRDKEFYVNKKEKCVLCFPSISAKNHQEYMQELYDDDTDYGAYAFGNQFYKDNDNFIEKKSNDARYDFTIVYEKDRYGVWYDYTYGTMYITQKVDPYCKKIYSFTNRDHAPNMMLVANYTQFPMIKKIKQCYEYGCLRFDTRQIKSRMIECLKWLS